MSCAVFFLACLYSLGFVSFVLYLIILNVLLKETLSSEVPVTKGINFRGSFRVLSNMND